MRVDWGTPAGGGPPWAAPGKQAGELQGKEACAARGPAKQGTDGDSQKNRAQFRIPQSPISLEDFS